MKGLAYVRLTQLYKVSLHFRKILDTKRKMCFFDTNINPSNHKKWKIWLILLPLLLVYLTQE
jgi:hypothetical protein